MEKGKLIGKGMTAEVYEWGQDKVLKLYFNQYSDDWVKYEADIGYAIHEASVSSPEVFDIVNVEGRKGLILQKISGKSLLKTLETEPWRIYDFAKQMARLHYEMHKCTAVGLPSQKERFAYTINRSSAILGSKEKRILDYVETLPNGTSVCHGDLHFNNVIASNNKLLAIDWNGAYTGNPLSDVARTCLIIASPSMPPGSLDIMVLPSQYVKWLTYWTYLSEYIRLKKVRIEDIDAWTLPVAAAKLKDKVNGEEKWLIDIINKRLKIL